MVDRLSTSSRLSSASYRSAVTGEDNARFLADIEGVDVFPPSSQAARRRALVRGAKALAVHDDTLTHAQRRELLHVAAESTGGKRSFDDSFGRFLDVIAAGTDQGEGEDEGEGDEEEGGQVGAVAPSRKKYNLFVAGPLAAIFAYALTYLFAKRLRTRNGPGGIWVVLMGIASYASENAEDFREWLWEGLCEGARSRFFENCFVLVVSSILARLPGRIAGLLEWIIE